MSKLISLSKRAIAYLSDKINKDPQKKAISIALNKAGCAGYMYSITLCDHIPDEGSTEVLDDLIVHIPTDSIPRIKGSVLDYKQEGLETKAVFTNPNVTTACGCGDSVELIKKNSGDS